MSARIGTDAREEILARIRTALADRPVPPVVPRDYRGVDSTAVDVELFVDRVDDYKATVTRVADGDVLAAVGRILHDAGLTRVVVPDGFPLEWLPDGLDVLREPLSVQDLDDAQVTLTTCAVAIAETGTIVLDAGPGQGRRALTLVPDRHLVVVLESQIVAGVPDAVARLDSSRPLTWISGPSATSDIELNRVEGVHGPRTLDVLLV